MYGIARDMRVVNCRFDQMDYASAVREATKVERRTHSKEEVRNLFLKLGYNVPKKGGRK